jgi:glutamine synthetase
MKPHLGLRDLRRRRSFPPAAGRLLGRPRRVDDRRSRRRVRHFNRPKTLDFVPRDLAHLRDVLAFGERADGSSLFGALGVSVTASDVVLCPRLSTAFIDPFASSPTLALLCGHHGRDGAPLPESPDTIVRKAVDRLKAESGVALLALGEVEYFLGKRQERRRTARRARVTPARRSCSAGDASARARAVAGSACR